MKTTLRILALAAALLAAPGCFTPGGRESGPPVSAVTHAAHSLVTARAAAQAALEVWAVHVADEKARVAGLPAAERFEPGNALLRQEGKVKDATLRFNAAFAAAEAPLRAALAAGHDFTAPAAVTAALAELTTLIQQFRR